MPKKEAKESFFIRASVRPDQPNGQYADTAIDLSAYVDALGKSVLEIKSIEGEWAAGSGAKSPMFPNGAPFMEGNKAGSAVWQLTTQRQTGLIGLDDRAVIAKGMIWARNTDSASNPPGQVYQDSHLPQHYSSSFLVATEQIYLGAQAEQEWDNDSDLVFNIVLECSVSTMTAAKAMSLALSQQ